jgi:hypothetical protein
MAVVTAAQLAAAPIPLSLDDIDPAWLTLALSSKHPGTVVEAISESEPRHGTTTNVKLRLAYASGGNASGLPNIMWLKAGMEAHSGMLAEQVGLYEREARFYANAQPKVAAITPRCFYAAADSGSKLGVTLLEDLVLKGAQLFHATRKVTLDDAAAGVRALGAIHRTFIDDPDLERYPWLTPLLNGNIYWDNTVGPAFLQTWLDEERSLTFPQITHDAHRISANLQKLAEKMPSDRRGLAHGDAHVGNSYRLADGTAGFYDWQCVGRASPIFDVAYYIISSLDTDVRRQSERDLLSEYLSAFNIGEQRMTMDAAWTAYRRYSMYGLWSWLTNPVDFHPQPVNIIQSNRFANAVADLETFEAIEGW